MKHLYQNEVTEWFVAESVEEARKLYRSYCTKNGIDWDEEYSYFQQTPDEKVLTYYDGYGNKITKPAKAFAEEHRKGFMMTTEY